MITLSEFVIKWLGKKADWDGHYDGQCVDLFRYYVDEVLGFPQPKGVGGAKDFWLNYDTDPNLKNYYEKITNTPTGVPTAGDVMIWNSKAGGGFGHVSIFLEGNASKFTSFDQNFPTLSKCTKTVHDYTNVYGWLRPNKVTTPPSSDELEKCRIDRDAHWNDRVAICKALELPEDATLDTILRSIAAYKGLAGKVQTLEAEKAQMEINRKEQVSRLENEVLTLGKERDTALKTVDELRRSIDEAHKEKGRVELELAKCQAGCPPCTLTYAIAQLFRKK